MVSQGSNIPLLIQNPLFGFNQVQQYPSRVVRMPSKFHPQYQMPMMEGYTHNILENPPMQMFNQGIFSKQGSTKSLFRQQSTNELHPIPIGPVQVMSIADQQVDMTQQQFQVGMNPQSMLMQNGQLPPIPSSLMNQSPMSMELQYGI